MKLLVGLGNPGSEYANNRHNIGFMLLDEIARRKDWEFKKAPGPYMQVQGKWGPDSVLMIKANTYMNRSGSAVKKAYESNDLQPADILVISDDIDLDFGLIRYRMKGSDGGHRGLRSIIDELGFNGFRRFRFGVRNEKCEDAAEFVLQDFEDEEKETISGSMETLLGSINMFIRAGIRNVMNKYNGVNIAANYQSKKLKELN